MEAIRVQTVYDWLDGFAPFDTAEAFDNVGLLLGDFASPVDKVLFCLDATLAAVEEAISLGVQLIVAHHPVMFGGIRHIDYTGVEGRALCGMIGAHISLIAAHTNFDKAPGGTGDSLAQVLGLQKPEPLDDFIRMGTLPQPMEGEMLAEYVTKAIGAPVRLLGRPKQPITRVAVGPGAYGEGACIALRAGAQAYIVGEIKHHELLDACTQGLVVLDAGHYATEAPGVEALYQRFQSAAAERKWQTQPLLFAKPPFTGAVISQ